MKRLILWSLVFVIGITACEGPAGRDGRDVERFVEEFVVYSEHWIQGEEEGDEYFFKYWEFEFSVPQITNDVLTRGTVNCYLIQEITLNGRTSIVQRPLPYTIYGIGDEGPYSENYSFEIRRGNIKFIVKYSDFEDIQPLHCTFRVVLIW